MPGKTHQRAKPDPDPAEQSDHGLSLVHPAGGVLHALSPEVYSNPEDAGVVGAAGVSTWRFQAFATGTGRLRLTSQQPWAPEVLPADAFDCAISVN